MRILPFLASLLLLVPSFATAQAPLQDQEYLAKSRIIHATEPISTALEGTSIEEEEQTVTIEVLEGPDAGRQVTFVNDFTPVETGDLVYVRHLVPVDGLEAWSIAEPYRLNVLLFIAIAFLIILFLFGGMQGVRGLASLIGSIALILWILIPNVYAGYSPILVSIGVASLIIILGSYLTHGFNRTTTVAMLGMLVTIVVVGGATFFAIHAAQLSGFTSDHNAYLNFMTAGRIDMIGLLFGGIMIGLLGVLYDIAIGQAVTVEELVTGTTYTRRQVFDRAMRVGREHIGALVNTLAIAYVGSSLPLLLLFQESDAGILYLLNSEVFATELIRILMGSIGLVLAVPVTTLLAALLVNARTGPSTHTHASHTPKNSSE